MGCTHVYTSQTCTVEAKTSTLPHPRDGPFRHTTGIYIQEIEAIKKSHQRAPNPLSPVSSFTSPPSLPPHVKMRLNRYRSIGPLLHPPCPLSTTALSSIACNTIFLDRPQGYCKRPYQHHRAPPPTYRPPATCFHRVFADTSHAHLVPNGFAFVLRGSKMIWDHPATKISSTTVSLEGGCSSGGIVDGVLQG